MGDHRIIDEGEQEAVIGAFLLAHEGHTQDVEVQRGTWSVYCRCARCGDIHTYEVDNEARVRALDEAMKQALATPPRQQFLGLLLEEDLRRALGRGELRVHYQPQVLLSTGEVVGFEALARWEHPGRGLLAPREFVPLAEETGMIVPLGRWVLAQACRRARIFRERMPPGYPPGAPLRMCVNLSAHQLRPEIVEEISEALTEAGMAPSDLALEITESVLTEEGRTDPDTLQALKDLGATLVMDDFGTGYSSITDLEGVPVDILKMDRSMVEGVDKDSEKRAMVSATTGLAHALGLGVVAEGVETAGELDELRSMGCEFAQGYYWQRPCPAEKMEELLAAGFDP